MGANCGWFPMDQGEILVAWAEHHDTVRAWAAGLLDA